MKSRGRNDTLARTGRGSTNEDEKRRVRYTRTVRKLELAGSEGRGFREWREGNG